MKLEKFGQAEYAYDILRQITKKLLAENILTQEQQKKLDEQNKDDCYRQFCTAWAA